MAFDYNNGAFWATLIGLPVAIILCYLTIQDNWHMARVSGQLKKPQLAFAIGQGLLPSPSEETRIIVGARKISESGDVVIGEIPFFLSNVGDATLENTSTTFRFHKMFHRDTLEGLAFSRSGSFEASQIQRSFTTSGELHYSSYFLPALNPGQSMGGMEPVYLPNTSLSVTAPVTLHDHSRATVTMNLEYGLTFLVSVTAKDVEVRDYPMALQTYPSG